MSDVSILGLGAMGSALARALLRARHSITVWNRTPTRAAELDAAGATVATSAAAAVAASPLVIVCVTDYAATRAALAGAALAGKDLVQLSTGTPREAREAEAWATDRGARYLDGAIIAVPEQIGGADAAILVAGSAAVHAASEARLRDLAATVTYVGTNAGAASAFDLAILAHLFSGLLGFYHGARICEAEGLAVADLGALLASAAPGIGGMIVHDAERIAAERYADPQSSLELCALATDLLVRHAREAALDPAIVAFAAAMFDRGRQAGLGAESPAALVKLLRRAGAR